jgi:D-alanine-D-alanine ligase
MRGEPVDRAWPSEEDMPERKTLAESKILAEGKILAERLRVGLLFGGRSAEHEVSLLSAGNVFRALDKTRYEVVPIAITKDGSWLLCDAEAGEFPKTVPQSGPRLALLPGGGGRLVVMPEADGMLPAAPAALDVIFPVLHGPFGEDGTVQGLAEIAGVPYVGSGVFASAAAMDKEAAKRLMREAGLPIARYLAFVSSDSPSFAKVVAELGRPVFVKPARLGSSVGVGKAATAAEFEAAIAEAFRHDRKILVEEFVAGREIECGVLENEDGSLFVSVPGEIVPTNRHAFYTYEAKYLDADGAEVKVPADLPPAVAEKVRELSAGAFRSLGCEGLSRIDFFVCPDERVLVNEVNTLPGFTAISMYPKAMAASGVSYSELVDRLILHALKRVR